MSDKSVLQQFEVQIILFDRLSDPENSLDASIVTYVKEFYPRINQQYTLSDLNVPVHALLASRIRALKSTKRGALLIGDSSELLFQSIIDVGFGFTRNEIDDSMRVNPFEEVALIDAKTSKNHLNLTEFDALFLKEQMPFEEEMNAAIVFRNTGMRGFENAYYVNMFRDELNDFFWYYHEDPLTVQNKLPYLQIR